MTPIHAFLALAALSACPLGVFAQDSFRPLDTRTRCIVLFRECLVLIDNKDVNGIFQITADGGASGYRRYPDPDSLPPDLKRELQDVNRFFKHNFKTAPLLKRTFSKIQFSELVTARESVFVTNTATDRKHEAKLHSINIKITIPDTDRQEIGELRFVQVMDRIYWIPIGW